MRYKLLKFRIKFNKVIVITIAWQLLAVIYTWYMHSFIETVTSGEQTFSLGRSIFYTLLAATFAGLIVGTIEVFFLKRLFRKRAFFIVVLSKSLFYFLLLVIIFYLVLAIYTLQLESDVFAGNNIFASTYKVFMSSTIVYDLLFWIMVMILTFLLLQFSDKFGPGGLAGYVFGRYHRPHKQTRIFMFLDIRDSTSIAEKLGHLRYFNFLNDFFSDVADSVVFSKGEIYQYVGDEVVVSWRLKEGLKNASFVRCFFDIKARIDRRKDFYNEEYGVVPQFKAGFNHGEVTAGEIGAVKKEVVFSGDVLNTGARIQEKCNFYGVDNLISKGLLKFIGLPERLSYRQVDTLRLKGKKKSIDLYTLYLLTG
ncbi:MAG: adenylate/guanylate cyclase domain-containing protein [Bacteroidales bacterium]|nr:adenylate/guanylate cyclase domain-containing protein [Bacteroidales bacterium]